MLACFQKDGGCQSPCCVRHVTSGREEMLGCMATKVHPNTALPDAPRAGPQVTSPLAARCNTVPLLLGLAALEGCLSRFKRHGLLQSRLRVLAGLVAQSGRACLPALFAGWHAAWLAVFVLLAGGPWKGASADSVCCARPLSCSCWGHQHWAGSSQAELLMLCCSITDGLSLAGRPTSVWRTAAVLPPSRAIPDSRNF